MYLYYINKIYKEEVAFEGIEGWNQEDMLSNSFPRRKSKYIIVNLFK